MLVSLTKLLQTKSKSQVRKLLETFKCNLNKDIEFFLINKAILLDAINHTKILRYFIVKVDFFQYKK